MTRLQEFAVWAVLVVLAGGVALTLASPGAFIIDEVIQLMGVDAMVQYGSLAVPNGYDALGSDDLRLWLLQAGPEGLAPQYPPGLVLIGAPFWGLFGASGLVLLNALAAVGTLAVTYRLTLQLHDDRVIALGAVLILGLATFLSEYAFGIWPHAFSALFVTGALLFAVKALDEEPIQAGIFSGFMVGAGMLFRTDTVLILPVIACLLLFFAQRPFAMALGGLIGLVPGIGLLAATNQVKFGTLNPLSYGSAGGGTDLTSHIGALSALAILALALLVARFVPWTAGRARVATIVAGAIVICAVAELSPVRDLAVRWLHGAWLLFIDITQIPEGRPGVEPAGGPTRLFWGAPKKALAQSLPWLGALVLIAVLPWQGRQKRGPVLALLALALWTLPFVLMRWHGGFGSNMRYFLPIVPVLCIVAAAVFVTLVKRGNVSVKALTLAVVLGLTLVFAWATLMPTGMAGAHQILTKFLFFAMLAVALVCLVSAETFAKPGALVMALCLGAATALGPFSDLPFSQIRRAALADAGHALSAIPSHDGVLFYGWPEVFAARAPDPRAVIAMHDRNTQEIDMGLIQTALDGGLRVYAERYDARRIAESRRFEMAEGIDAGPTRIYEIRPVSE